MASSGNFCTLNPLAQPNSGTFAEGNLYFKHTTSDWRTTAGTFGITSGKWYWEAYQYKNAGNGFPVGIYDISGGKLVSNQASAYPGRTTSTYGLGYAVYTNSGTYASKYTNQNETNTTLSVGDAGDVWQCALDLDNNKIWFGKNNTWDNSADPSANNNESYAIDSGKEYAPVTCSYSNSSSEDYPQNYGQDSSFSGRITAGGNADENGFGDFKYAPPTGFLALCSGNINLSSDVDPAQTDDDFVGGKQFGAYAYTGNNGSARTVSTDFQPDLIWIKSRDSTDNHYLQDSSRGFGNSKSISSNATGQEGYNGGAPSSSGAQNVGSSSFQAYGSDWSRGTDNMIAWCWRANGGTTASNTDGSITSTVQANTKAGFSIVTYTGNATNGATFGHGLSAKPSLVFIKNRDASQKWGVWHQSMTQDDNKILFLNTSAALTTEGTQRWDVSAISSSVFGLGSHPEINGSGADYVAYIWHNVEGFQKFGKFEGNANNDGPFVYTGFRPRMLFIKNSEATSPWTVYDGVRGGGFNNPSNSPAQLFWDENLADHTSYGLDIYSNGFKLRTSNATVNSSHTWLFGAWGDVPFKYNNTF